MLRNIIFPNRYSDSVFLMLISRKVGEIPGIEEVSAMMATANNKEILTSGGFIDETGLAAGPNDLLICLKASDEGSVDRAMKALEGLLEASGAPVAGGIDFLGVEIRPRTLATALSVLPAANLAFISLPGEYASREAARALDAGLHVMLFSDNVSLAEELALKRRARELGLIVMGPDCGTAVVNGVALGFANVVARGGVGIVGASGTGLQAITVLVERFGGGISQALGTGGRDLSSDIGGISMLTAIEALEADSGTKVVVLLSKPPHPEVADMILDRVAMLKKPSVVCFMGRDPGPATQRGIRTADTLEKAARLAVSLCVPEAGLGLAADAEVTGILNFLGRAYPDRDAFDAALPGRFLRGLYSGGTLCDEAVFTLAGLGMKVRSNIAVPSERRVCRKDGLVEHCLVDLGEDEFTVGVPHPMIDFHLRNQWISDAFGDPETRVVLLDVVLGWGSNPDPAGELIPALATAAARRNASGHGNVLVVASVCGTPGDPQNSLYQEERLKAAGVLVLSTNERAAAVARAIAEGDLPFGSIGPALQGLFGLNLFVISM